MRAAAASGRIPADPTAGRRFTPKRRADQRSTAITADQVLTRTEALAILGAAPIGYRAAVALGLAGLRIGEMLGLGVNGVDIDRRLVTVERQVTVLEGKPAFTTPKMEKVRTIKVPAAVALELRRHLRTIAPGGLLFPGPDGGPMDPGRFRRAVWQPTLRAAGVFDLVTADGEPVTDTDEVADDDKLRTVWRFTFHSLRHFCASNLLAKGASLTAVAGHLGDVVATITTVYAHWLRDDRDVPADVLDRVLSPAEDSLRTGTDQ